MFITIALDGNEATDGQRIDRIIDQEGVEYKETSEEFKKRKKNRNRKHHKSTVKEAIPYNPRIVSPDIAEEGVKPNMANWLGRFDRPRKKKTRRILM